MSDTVIDMVIFVLLVVSAGFGGIGVIGLLLFPDIRSRMYTAFRATVISLSAMVVAAIIFALFILQSNGGDQYVTLIIHALVLLCIVIVANMMLYKTILERTKMVGSCDRVPDQAAKPENKE